MNKRGENAQESRKLQKTDKVEITRNLRIGENASTALKALEETITAFEEKMLYVRDTQEIVCEGILKELRDIRQKMQTEFEQQLSQWEQTQVQ